MSELLTAVFAIPLAKWSMIGITGIVLGHLAKKVPTKTWREKLEKYVGPPVYFAGIAVSAFMGGKFKYTKPFWEKIIEPVAVVLLERVVAPVFNVIVDKFVAGMKSDNLKKADESK